MSHQVIVSKGIYHGLPTYADSLNGLTVIVTGANGISGDHMLRVLCESPERWTKIYALSRRPPNGKWPSHVKHIPMDFMQSPEVLAATFKKENVQAEYVFFFSYIQSAPKEGGGIWSAVEDLVKDNTQLLHNFLEGLVLAEVVPKSVLLQLGAKYYGVHLGPGLAPLEESDPRILLEPNFYYHQEDLLKDFATKHGSSWVTTRPSAIPGAVPDAAMNLCFPLAVYALVQKHLGNPLEWPADLEAWQSIQTFSSAQMNSYFSEWTVLSGNVNQSFNIEDGCVFSWGKFWPKMAARFDMSWKGPNVQDDATFNEIKTPYTPPPRGYGPAATMRFRFTLTEWAKRPEVQDAWKDIAAKHQLREPALRDVDRIFGFADGMILPPWNGPLSSTKVKKLGWFGFVDTAESMFKVFDEFVVLRMIPPLP